MAKKKAETIFLVCEECGDYNYSVRRKPGGEKLRVKKYCPRLRKHTFHGEKKKEFGQSMVCGAVLDERLVRFLNTSPQSIPQ